MTWWYSILCDTVNMRRVSGKAVQSPTVKALRAYQSTAPILLLKRYDPRLKSKMTISALVYTSGLLVSRFTHKFSPKTESGVNVNFWDTHNKLAQIVAKYNNVVDCHTVGDCLSAWAVTTHSILRWSWHSPSRMLRWIYRSQSACFFILPIYWLCARYVINIEFFFWFA